MRVTAAACKASWVQGQKPGMLHILAQMDSPRCRGVRQDPFPPTLMTTILAVVRPAVPTSVHPMEGRPGVPAEMLKPL